MSIFQTYLNLIVKVATMIMDLQRIDARVKWELGQKLDCSLLYMDRGGNVGSTYI